MDLEPEKQIEKTAERIHTLATSGVNDLVEIVKRPWRLVWINFLISVARGIGFSLGVGFVSAVALTLIFRVLSEMIDIPLIGNFAAKFLSTVQDQMQRLPKSPK